jgi:toxin ParE1/3/4
VERRVVFSPEAAADLFELYEYIAKQSGPARAIGYIQRIENHCSAFKFSAERGTRRDDVRPGLRVAGFERRVTIAFHVEPTKVVIDRILYGGRDVRHALKRRGRTRRARPD